MHLKPADGTVFKYSPRACFTTRGHAPPARKIAGRLDEVSEGEEGLFGQRLAVGEDAARLGVADDPLRVEEGGGATREDRPLRVEEGDGTAREDRLQIAAAALAQQLQLLLVGQTRLARAPGRRRRACATASASPRRPGPACSCRSPSLRLPV
uniref:Uncharacterized protein n=2 Tax=Emiliania huxleyi TaxID=2903 RepID=A0A7S3WEF0_EMIHU